MEITELLARAYEDGASDIHISTGHPPIFRLHGEMVNLKVPPLNADQVKNILNSIMSDKQRDEFEENMDLDFAIHFAEHRYRVNAFNTIHGPACVLRSIPTTIRTLRELQAPEVMESLASLHKGLVLVTGPTGSGKSTTVASLVNHINRNFSKHILTIEDPIEFVHKSEKSLVSQREIGVHSKSFAKALKGSLREDPDIIMVGELRDLETIQLAITAAETGHLVIATLHTSSAAQTVDRMIDVFPSEDKDMIRTMLSNSLEAVISQKLIKSGGSRVGAYEVLIAIPAIRNLIREGKIAQISSMMQINSKIGMKVMKDSVAELLSKGLITQDAANSAMNLTENPDNKEIKTAAHSSSSGGF
jgi:twitching motility protein PilT